MDVSAQLDPEDDGTPIDPNDIPMWLPPTPPMPFLCLVNWDGDVAFTDEHARFEDAQLRLFLPDPEGGYMRADPLTEARAVQEAADSFAEDECSS